MRIQRLLVVIALAVFFVIQTGCSKKADASTELANTVKVLEQPNPTPQAPAQPSPATPATQPAQQVSQALTSLKAGKYTDTIVQMEMARSNPNKTPQQTLAIQDAMAAVMSDLYTRAANGDAAAKQAIAKYQAERNRR